MTDRIQAQSVVETLDRALGEIDQARAYNEWLFDRARPHLGRRVPRRRCGPRDVHCACKRAKGPNVVAVEPEAEFAGTFAIASRSDERVEVVQGTVDEVADSRTSTRSSASTSWSTSKTTPRRSEDVRRAARPDGRLLLARACASPALRRLRPGGRTRPPLYEERLESMLAGAGFELESCGTSTRVVRSAGSSGCAFAPARSGRQARSGPSTGSCPCCASSTACALPFGLSLWAVARRA